MALSFNEAREFSLISLCTNIINKEPLGLLYNVNSSNNLHFPYENYKYVWLRTWFCLIYIPIFQIWFQILISNDFNQNLFLVLKNQFIEKKRQYKNCWVFIDDTVCPVCGPQSIQIIIYIEHKRVHAIKDIVRSFSLFH